MKRLIIFAAAALLGAASINAQSNVFNHLGVGVSAGTEGFGVDLSTPVTNYLALRAGFTAMPKVKYAADVDIDSNSSSFTRDEVEVEGKLNMSDVHVLLDIYPFKSSGFHLTAGAYFGKEKLISLYNTEEFLERSEWGVSGIKLGDYRITSDDQGNVSADVKVKSFKPYLGFGFGRAVPKKRISVSFDLGVQFWGEPGIWTTTKNNFGDVSYSKLKKGDVDNDDTDKLFDIMSKITVYPVLSLRINGRIF